MAQPTLSLCVNPSTIIDPNTGLAADLTAIGGSSEVAQGSTTSGQSGPIIQGAVTTAAPTYTTGKTDPVSLDTTGNLRTVDSNVANTTGVITAATSPTKMQVAGVVYNSTPPTLTTGQSAALEADVKGSLKVIQVDASGVVIDPTLAVQTYVANSYAHISTAATTVVKSGTGSLHSITVNGLGTVASVTTVYDNTAGSGTIIAVINTLAGQESYIYDVTFNTGLTLVTTGTVAPDITVSYR